MDEHRFNIEGLICNLINNIDALDTEKSRRLLEEACDHDMRKMAHVAIMYCDEWFEEGVFLAAFEVEGFKVFDGDVPDFWDYNNNLVWYFKQARKIRQKLLKLRGGTTMNMYEEHYRSYVKTVLGIDILEPKYKNVQDPLRELVKDVAYINSGEPEDHAPNDLHALNLLRAQCQIEGEDGTEANVDAVLFLALMYSDKKMDDEFRRKLVSSFSPFSSSFKIYVDEVPNWRNYGKTKWRRRKIKEFEERYEKFINKK